jgi:hypothetical protein
LGHAGSFTLAIAMDPSLDPRKNPHLRPQLNPFSIFGSEAVPDIFDEPLVAAKGPRVPQDVPAIDAFSLPKPAAPTTKTAAVVAVAEDDDSFFDEDDKRDALAELEAKLAQAMADLKAGAAARRALEEEVAQLHAKLAQQKRKEVEDNKVLEAALLAIETKLQAANARASVAEAESAQLRERVSDNDGVQEYRKKLTRAAKTAANLSLEFSDATSKSGAAIKDMYLTMTKLTALLASFEKVVAE